MNILQLNKQTGGSGSHAQLLKPIAALAIAFAMVLGISTVSARADDLVDLTPGPTIIADADSPTGYTGHFVYYNPTATSVRFVADILLRDWDNPTSPTVYQPSEYRPGLMRGGGGYDVEMTKVGDYWVTDVPLAAGANQYWFYVNNDTNRWIVDPANPPIYAPDGLTGNARRAFNTAFVPYDAEKQNYAPLAARQIELPRADSPKGTWSYVPVQIGDTQRTMGVYLPPAYDPDRAEPYKTIYMQHGGGQDQSDWMNMGDVPVIMDNLLQDGLTEPAIIVTTGTAYLGAAGQGYPNLRNIVLPFVESNYNVSTSPKERAFAGLSAGGIVTYNLINFDATAFGYYGVWSGGVGVRNTTPNLDVPYILFGGGGWDFGLPNASQVAALTNANAKNVVVSGAHDFNAWNQLFTTFAKDYLWKPNAFITLDVSATASVRCVAGKALVYTTVANADNAAVDLTLGSTYGSKSFTGIAPGKSAVHSYTTRLASVPAGTVTVDATAVINGDAVSTPVTAAYNATSCN